MSTTSRRRERLALELRRSRVSIVTLAAGAVISAGLGAVVLDKLDVRWPWTTAMRFDVEVTSASGVTPGRTSVTVAGVKAGRVTGVRRDGDVAVLRVELEPGYGPIATDARLRLRPRTPLQDMVLDVTDRGRGRPIGSGDRISAEQTRTSVAVSAVLDTFAPPTRARLSTLLQQLGTGLDDRGARLREAFVAFVPLLRATERLTGEVARRDRLTRRLVRESGTLFAELARRDEELTGLVRDGGTTLRAIADERDALARTLDELAPTVVTLRRASGALADGLGRTRPALRALGRPARRLPDALASLDRLGADARPVLAALRPAIRALTPAVVRAAPAARALRLAADRLAPQMSRLDGIAEDVVRCRYALNKFFQNTLSFYKYGGPYGPVGRSALVYGSAQALGEASPSEYQGPACTDQEGSAG